MSARVDNAFSRRLPVPAIPLPEDTVCYRIEIPNEPRLLEAFEGMIHMLSKWPYWAQESTHAGIVAANVFKAVYDSLEAHPCDEIIPDEGECIEHKPYSPVITWYPSDPYLAPSFVPTGYQKPPWHVVSSDDTALILLGFQAGDVMNDLSHFPPGSLPTVVPPDGLPRFRVEFQGNDEPEGVTVELHFVIIPAGGRVLIIDDDQFLAPLPELANLNRDVLAAPPVTSLEVVIERNFIGTGPHVVECQWFPAVNDEIPFLYFGGGLRKVVICGEDVTVPIPQLEVDGCILRFRASGSLPWQEYDLSACATSVFEEKIHDLLDDGTLGGSQPGPKGDTEVGFCKTFHVTLNANGKWLCPIPIKANYTIQISNATGGANDGTIDDWRCPSGTIYFLGQCGSGSGGTEPTDPLSDLGHMRLIMRYDDVYHDAYNLTHTVSSSLVGSKDLEFQVNDSELADNSGSYQFDLQVCNYGACVPVFVIEPEYSTSTFADGIFTATAHTPRPDANNAYQVFYGVGDQNNNPCPCRFLEIIELTGYTGPDEEDNFNGGSVYPCSGGIIVNEHGAGVQNWEAFYNGLDPADQCIRQFDVKSATPFVMKFRVIEC